MPSKLVCQWTDGSATPVEMYVPLKVYVLYNIDVPIASFWSKKQAEEARDEVLDHIMSIAGRPLDVCMMFNIKEVPTPALYSLITGRNYDGKA
jgi:hypothetical protein